MKKLQKWLERFFYGRSNPLKYHRNNYTYCVTSVPCGIGHTADYEPLPINEWYENILGKRLHY